MRSLRIVGLLALVGVVAVGCGPKTRGKKARGGGDWSALGAGGGGGEGEGGEGSEGGGAAPATLATTGAASNLQRVTTDPIDEERPMLSPDGSTLLVGLRTWTKKDGFHHPGIVAINPNGGGGRTMMTPGGIEADRAAWLPDGSSYVYATNGPGAWALVRAQSKSAGAPYTVIAPGDVAPGADYPSVAPDGLIALTVEQNKVLFIATIRLDGSGYQLLQQGNQAAFSHDGKRLAFIRDVNGSTQLFVSARDGAAVAQLTFGKAAVYWPTWSPDGQWIAFATNRGTEYQSDDAQRYQLFVVRPDGSGLMQLTNGTADCGFPMWGVDGFVYFNANKAGNYDIWRLRPNPDLGGSAI